MFGTKTNKTACIQSKGLTLWFGFCCCLWDLVTQVAFTTVKWTIGQHSCRVDQIADWNKKNERFSISHCWVAFSPLFQKRVLVHNLSYGNEFDLQDNERARKTYLNMKGCAPRLGLKQRLKQLGNGLLWLYCAPFFKLLILSHQLNSSGKIWKLK